MKLDMDKVVFESRNEISVLQNALEIVISSKNSTNSEKKIVKELASLLDVMDMNW